MTKILLITTNKNIIETFAEKLVLLREADELSYCDYADAPDIVFSDKPDVVIVHENDDKEKLLNLIKYIKTQTDSVLLLINKYDRDFVLSAYDEGIDDYFSINADPSEISIRTVNCIKKDNLKKQIKRNTAILQQYGIFDKHDELITHKFAKEICETELDPNGALLIISPDEKGKLKFSSDKLIPAIKKSVRFNDIITHSNGTKIFILTKNGGISGAVTIFEKLKHELDGEFSIKAGVCETDNEDFSILEKHAQCALSEALLGNHEIIIYSQDNISDGTCWLDQPKEKNFKLFKTTYNKKLEKVIAPVFYRLQKSWEEKLFNTKIEQYTDDIQSIFRLSHPKQTSLLKILYPGFAKVIVYITHEGLDSPENNEISIPLNQINTKELTKIVENFIKEFKHTIE